jgi:hypothetical protein
MHWKTPSQRTGSANHRSSWQLNWETVASENELHALASSGINTRYILVFASNAANENVLHITHIARYLNILIYPHTAIWRIQSTIHMVLDYIPVSKEHSPSDPRVPLLSPSPVSL